MVKNILVLLIIFSSINLFSQDSTFINLESVITHSLIFYKDNNFAFALEKKDVLQNKKYFKHY